MNIVRKDNIVKFSSVRVWDVFDYGGELYFKINETVIGYDLKKVNAINFDTQPDSEHSFFSDDKEVKICKASLVIEN